MRPEEPPEPPPRRPRVAHVEDHPVVRTGLARFLDGWAELVASVGTTQDLEALLARGATPRPDLVVLDYRLPDSDLAGQEAVRRVTGHLRLPVVVLANAVTWDLDESCRTAGAAVVLDKGRDDDAIRQTIESVLNGDPVTGPAEAAMLENEAAALTIVLTPAQARALELTMGGLRHGQAGKLMGVDARTVEGHMRAVYAVVRAARLIGPAEQGQRRGEQLRQLWREGAFRVQTRDRRRGDP